MRKMHKKRPSWANRLVRVDSEPWTHPAVPKGKIMAEKNKKRGGRRAHLNDFHVNLAGDYVYTGAHYSYGPGAAAATGYSGSCWD